MLSQENRRILTNALCRTPTLVQKWGVESEGGTQLAQGASALGMAIDVAFQIGRSKQTRGIFFKT